MVVVSGEGRELEASSYEQMKKSPSTTFTEGQGETNFNAGENSPKKYYPQIDYIKGLAILSVLLLHTIPSTYLIESYSTLYIWQAVPIFMIMMGITYHLSFIKMGQNAGITYLYTKEYFRSKLGRFMLPFILVCIIDLIVAVLLGRLDGHAIISILLSFVGILPVPMPGGYFITILFQFILFAPLIFLMISRRPIAALILLFVANLGFELAGPWIPYALYYYSILRYLSAVGLGFFFADEILRTKHLDVQNTHQILLFILAGLSLAFIILFNGSYFPYFRPEWRTQNILSFFYPLILIVLIFSCYSVLSRFTPARLIGRVGAASYHIFLVQMVYFGLGASRMFIFDDVPVLISGFIVIIINVTICCILGILFYLADEYIRKKKKSKVYLTRSEFPIRYR